LPDTPVVWLGSSLKDIRRFPEKARRLAGTQLRRIQQGMMPLDWKPMVSVGHGVYEARIRAGGEYRLIYIAKFEATVYVLHAFEKRRQTTSPFDIAIAKARLAMAIRRHRGR
jgi:phage-related protein